MLLQIAGQLRELDHEVGFYLWEKGYASFLEGLGFDVFTGNKIKLEPGDIFLVPEGWPNVLSQGISSGAKCTVYCQNWAYLFSGLPEDVAWADLPVDFISVSDPVRIFIKESLGKDTSIIRPFIDQSVFTPPETKPGEIINIAYMPRKNRILYKQIRRIFEARNPGLASKINWISIEGLQQQEVAQHLKDSHIFLATGFPEGCPLPPLEAMACGCMVVGFAGFGGWDYMRQVHNGFAPQLPLRAVPWKGNGYFSADGDVLNAAFNLERAVNLYRFPEENLSGILENSLLTAGYYSKQNQKKEIFRWKSSNPQ